MNTPKPPRLTRRFAPRNQPMRVPCPLAGQPGMVIADAAWGTIQPITIAPGVRTVGELEVIAHLEERRPLIDTRAPTSFQDATIPGARNIPHTDAASLTADVDPTQPTIFFCNGPQCPATPDAIQVLLTAGHPPDAILYYRGGLHDWVSLGLPLEQPNPGDAAPGGDEVPAQAR